MSVDFRALTQARHCTRSEWSTCISCHVSHTPMLLLCMQAERIAAQQEAGLQIYPARKSLRVPTSAGSGNRETPGSAAGSILRRQR